jgi:hypothetical protein
MKNNCEMIPNCAASKEIQDMANDVREIKIALLGNQFNKNGLMNRVEKAETDIKTIKGRLIYFAGIGVGAGIFVGIIIGKIWK